MPKPKTPAQAKAAKKANRAAVAKTISKQDRLIGLLRRPQGATIDELSKATGWQPHSVRGAISGVLKKRLGFAVTTEKVEKRGRIYRLPAKG